jgi:hypothetical protein
LTLIPDAMADLAPNSVLALYLPQYHPIAENDQFWGRGFTEWRNVAKALPLFPGHRQPNLPADLGFYDLRVPETRQAQADMARAHHVDAFCLYHYWFAGRRVLERPMADMLASQTPDFPFCLCWANDSWTGVWHGAPNQLLIEQTYPGDDDHRAHFAELLPAFRAARYACVGGKPVFVVFKPEQLPDARHFTDLWQALARQAGLPGIHFVGFTWDWDWDWDHRQHGFDASMAQHRIKLLNAAEKPRPDVPTVYRHTDLVTHFIPTASGGREMYPCLVPNWDNTPRSGINGMVFHGSTPTLFRDQIRRALDYLATAQLAHPLVFIKAWNEWAEGNHLEPGLHHGLGYLEVLRDEMAPYRQHRTPARHSGLAAPRTAENGPPSA